MSEVYSYIISIPIPNQNPSVHESESLSSLRDGDPSFTQDSLSAQKDTPQLIFYYFKESKSLQFVLQQSSTSMATVQSIEMKIQPKNFDSKPRFDEHSKSVSIFKKTDSKLPSHITTMLASIVSGASNNNNDNSEQNQFHEILYVTGWFVGNFQWESNEEYWISWMGATKKYFASKIRNGLFHR